MTARILTLALDGGPDDLVEMLTKSGALVQVLDDTTIEPHTAVTDLGDVHDTVETPMSPKTARSLADEHGLVTVVTTVDQDAFLMARAIGRQTHSADDEHDLVHGRAFSFGLPQDCSLEILAVAGDDFLVRYTTDVITGGMVDD